MTTPAPVHVRDALTELKRRRDAARTPTATTPTASDQAVGDILTITDPQAYVTTALARLVNTVASTTVGGRNQAAHEAARSVGRMAGGGLPIDKTAACLAILDACRTNGHVQQDGEKMAVDTIRSGYTWGYEHPVTWVHTPATVAPAGTPFDPPDDWLQANPAVTAGVVDGDALATYRAQLATAELEKERARRAARRLLDAEESADAFTRVPLKRGDTFLAEPDPPITWAINELCQIGHNVLLTAQYKTGKTTFLLNLARAIADGTKFLDHFETSLDLGNIAMLDYELDAAQYRRWMRDTGIGNTARIVIGHWRGVRGRFDDERNITDLIDQLATAEVGVAVIDPFAAAAKGVDENDNGAVGAFLNLIDYIKRESGVHTVILATHTGRRDSEIGNERARGATRLDDWPDVRWLLTKSKDDGVRFFAADGRDVNVPAGALDYDDQLRRYRYTGNTPAILAARGLEDLVLDYVTENPGCSAKAIETNVVGGSAGIRKAVKNLAYDGRLADVGQGQAHKYVIGRARPKPFDPTSSQNLV